MIRRVPIDIEGRAPRARHLDRHADGRPAVAGRNIVGRIIDPDEEGRLVLFGLDTSRAQIDAAANPGAFAVRLQPGTEVSVAIETLEPAPGGRVAIDPVDFGASEEREQIRAIVIRMDLVLIVTGVMNL